jgi:uncharacterized protein YfaS (alpha-2-macroglobulin family)
MRRTRFGSLLCLWAAITTACTPPAATVAPKAPTAPRATSTPASAPARGRSNVALSNTHDADLKIVVGDPDARPDTPVTATPLDDATTAQLLARLPPLPAVPTVGPPTRPASLPPPRTTPVQPLAFAMTTGKPVGNAPLAPKQAPATYPLPAPEILPHDEVRAESTVRVRFAESMIPVAKIGDLAVPPATITPAVAGTWRWLDTSVLVFETKAARLPQATAFTVTVPAGTMAVSGAKLAEPAVGTFRTAPVRIVDMFPRELRPDGAVAIGFDQAIDPAAIAKHLTIATPKGRRIAFEVIDAAAAAARWKRDPSIDTARLEQFVGKHYVLLAPTTTWPAGVEATVTLGKGAPSAEGPLVAAAPSQVAFRVIPPFTVRGFQCGYSSTPRMTGTCPARSYGSLVFSNWLDRKVFRADMVQIEGEELQDHAAYGNSVGLTMPDVAGRTIAFRVDDGLVDKHGQRLTCPRRPTLTTTREVFEPWVRADTGLNVVDPRYEIPQWVVRGQAISALRVQLYKVTPADYFAYEAFEANERAMPPGTRVLDRTYNVGARGGISLRVDLRPALSARGVGHAIAIATVDGKPWLTQRTWLQVTKLAVSARVDDEQVSGWVQDLARDRFLAPRATASAQLLVAGRTAAPPTPAGADGHVVFDLPPPPATRPQRDPLALLAISDGDDSTFAAISRFEKTERRQTARWYVTDDRFTYKPGEKVYVKGWVRWTDNGPNPDLALPAAGETVAWTLVDVRDNEIASGDAPLSDTGGFDLEAALPPTINLGTARFVLTARGATQSHPIAIEEFRTPAFAVSLDDDVTHAGTLPLVVGERLEMKAGASYYAGGGLSGASISWTARLETTTYRPPNWGLYSFAPPTYFRDLTTERATTNLSASSASAVALDLASLHADHPSVLTVDAIVTDVDRQRIRASSRAILVHPSSYYVGMRKRPGKVDALEVIVIDIDGEPVAGVPVEVTLEGVLGSERGRDDAKVLDTQTCKLVSTTAPVVCPFKPKDINTSYLAVAQVADARGRINRAQYQVPWWQYENTQRELWMVADQPSYKPGDVAKLELHSKVFPATAVVTFARQGNIAEKRVALAQETTVVEVPIDEAYLTNVHVVVDRIAERTSPMKSFGPIPGHLTESIDLPVDVESARLAMRTRLTTPIIEPGATPTFEVEVRRDDKPVADAEVALIIVDEAVLALADKRHADPLPGFFQHVGAGVDVVNSYGSILDAGGDLAGRPGVDRYSLDGLIAGTGSGYGIRSVRYGMSGHGARAPSLVMGVVDMREDFRANAVFSPRLRTDANGKARVTVKMPDSLTRFRVVALGAAGTRNFGIAENTVVTQRKLNARTQAPRFLTQGDAFSLPVIVQNLDTQPRTMDVAVRAANLASQGPMGKRVTVAAGQRAEVRFDFASRARGKAAIQTIVVSGAASDASQVELPVYAPATTESFATYGVIDDAAKFEQLAIPNDVFPDVGGVEVEVASSQLQALTDAYWYLFAYPHECAEQRASRMLATAAIFDVLEAFALPGRPTRADIDAQRALDLKKLAAQQNVDGGFGYFNGMASDPFVSTHVVSALAAIKDTGAMRREATAYVDRNITALLATLTKDTSRAITQARRDDLPFDVSLAAADLTALARTGVDVTARALRLHALASQLRVYPVEAKARVLALLAGNARAADVRRALLAQLVSATQETASAATVTTRYVDAERLLLVSNTRTTALVLDALMRETPAHPLVTKLARGLLDGRKRGRWSTTQDNVAVMQAMRRYFDTYEKVTPSFTGKLWLGNTAYAEQSFAGRSLARAQTTIGWPALGPGSTHDIAFAKDGAGRMYYRLGVTYAPEQVDLPALDAGFVVRRTYTAIDDPGDVTKLTDGRVRVKLGARVLVTVETLNTTLRHSVAIVDPMPAGFESVNAALATSERPASVAADTYWDFRNLRDDRSEVFAMRLSEGVHRFTYTVRATTPGTFVAAPAKAEEMYSPETFGRSTGVTVVIE